MLEFLKEKKNFVEAISFFVFILSIFFIVKTVGEIKDFRLSNSGMVNTISVTGDGEIFAVPDIATISFSVTQESKTMAEAQKTVSAKIDSILGALSDAGISDRDIKTLSYTSYPKYSNEDIVCISYPCTRPKQEISGYEVSQTISVKVRDTETAPNVVETLGKFGVSNMNGPEFSIDDEDELKALARKQAIDDAKAKAKILAKDLDVKLVRIVNFSEDGGYYPMYSKTFAESDMAVSAMPIPSVSLPEGENRIPSTVTIIYEIR